MSAVRKSHLNCLSRSRVWGKEMCSHGTNFRGTRRKDVQTSGRNSFFKKRTFYLVLGYGGSDSKESAYKGGDPWVRKIPWRRAWQPTPVLLPGESQGQRSLVGCSPPSCRESDTTERRSLSLFSMADYQCCDSPRQAAKGLSHTCTRIQSPPSSPPIQAAT